MLKRLVGGILSLLLGCTLLPLSAFAENSGNANQSLAGFWNLRMSQCQEKDPYNQRNINDLKLGLSLKYSPFDYAFVYFVPNFKYKNGYQQTESESEARQSELGVSEASFNFGNKLLLASVGVLDQSTHRPDLLFYDQSFAGLKLSAMMAGFFAEAEYVIPTSSSLSTQTKEEEKTPEFISAGIGYETTNFSFTGSYGLGTYEFTNLPSATATKSGLRGNSTRPTAGRDSEFIYGYSGYYFNSNSEARIYRGNYIGLNFDHILNSKVETKLGDGLDVLGYWKLVWNKNFAYKPFYQYFRIESDAAIASYNRSLFGTNRQGYRAGLEVIFKQKLSVSASFGEKDALIENPSIQRDKFIFLNLETTDVGI